MNAEETDRRDAALPRDAAPAPASAPDAAPSPSPGPTVRRPGTITWGLLLLLGVAVIGVAVLPQPRLEAWLVAVVAVLGLSLVLVIIALLPRRIGTRRTEQDATDPTTDEVAAGSEPSVP